VSATRTRPKIWKWATLAAVLLIAAGIALFQWNWLRGPIGSAVQQKTGRPFVIAGDLDVGLFRGPLIRMQDVRFDNPAWAEGPHLITAREAEFTIDFAALLEGRLVFPYVRLSEPEVSLQRSADGQRNWVLQVVDDGTARAPEIHQLSIDRGVLRYRDAIEHADMTARISSGPRRSYFPGRTGKRRCRGRRIRRRC
jgi:AsmA family protein